MMNRLLISTWLCLWLGVGSTMASIPILQLDINHAANNTAAETESGFTAFTIADSGTVVNGVRVEFAGTLDSRRRGAPAGVPFEQIYRDFLFSRPGGMTVTLSGLMPGALYEVTIYAFDTSSDNLRVADWMSGGERVLQAQFLNTEPPTAADHYAFSGLVSADANGTIVLEAVAGEGTVEPSGANHPFAFLNALVLSLEIDPSKASIPHPPDQAVDVPRDTVLRWTPGQDAVRRDVYLGTTLADVNDASRSNPLEVLVSQGQTATTFDPGLLEYGTTYYWRIDEVNAPPDSTIFKGEVWSFETEPYAYPLAGVIATASSYGTDMPPERTVDGSGLDPLGRHSTDGQDMWLTSDDEELPAWIQFEFPGLRRLQQMKVWNFNESFERFVGLGAKDVVIEYSLDGEQWIPLKDVVIPRASAGDTYAGADPIDLENIEARFVRLVIETNWGSQDQTGLSEVQFLHIPMQAREPQPVDGATDVVVGTDLTWRPGREVQSHEVYLGADADAVAAGTVPASSQTQRTYTPPALDLGTTYFWRVDQVGELGVYAGELWSFTTQEHLVIEDFESYNDDDNPIYEAWVDGWDVGDNGSQVGHDIADGDTFGERGIVRPGSRQSMPLYYGIGDTAYSEATRTFDSPRDWTLHGVKGLTLWFFGDPDNTLGQLYVKVNGSKVSYDGDAANLRLKAWQMWYVDLAGFTGVNLKNVTTLTLGTEGGKGLVFIDDIALSPKDRQLVTPIEPNAANLVAHYAFEGNVNDSAGTRHGTVTGAPEYVPGKVGQAIKLDGARDFVMIESSFDLPVYSAALWFRVEGGTGNRDLLSIYDSDGNHGVLVEITGDGTLRFLHRAPVGTGGGVNIYSRSAHADGAWHHAAVVKSADQVTLHVNGQSVDSVASDTQLDQPLQRLMIGILKHDAPSRFFPGAIDEVYLYNRVLSDGEIAWLAGRTQPYDKP